MSGTVSTRFYFTDWQSDPGVRASSLAARGLWMEILSVAAQNKGPDHGFLLVAGRKLTTQEIARLASCSENEVEPMLAELERNGVFNRDKRGVIYSRRMVRAEKNRGNGRLGGNPKLLNKKDNPDSVEPETKPLIPVPEPIPSSLRSEDSLFDLPKPPQKPKRNVDLEFSKFWTAFPRKVGKDAAEKAFAAALKRGAVPEDLIGPLAKFAQSHAAAGTEARFIPHASTWLNEGRWKDEELPAAARPCDARGSPSSGRSNGMMEAMQNFIHKHGDFPNDDQERRAESDIEDVQFVQLIGRDD